MKRIGFILLICTVQLWTTDARSAQAQSKTNHQTKWSFIADVEINSALVGAVVSNAEWFDTVAFAVRMGTKRKKLKLFGFAEYGFFGSPEYDPNLKNNILNTGVGISIDFFKNKMTTMLQVGPSILLSESFQNDKGTTGLFSEIRPAGFVIPFKKFNLQIYPITFAWIMPVMKNIPLIYIHYRTAISVGGSF